MKLSEIRGEDNAALLANIMEPIGKIAMDEKYAHVFPIEAKKNETPKQAFTRFCFTILPKMIKDHKDAVCDILSIVSNKPAEEMIFTDILAGVTGLITDEVFLSFFSSAATKKEGSPRTDTSEK